MKMMLRIVHIFSILLCLVYLAAAYTASPVARQQQSGYYSNTQYNPPTYNSNYKPNYNVNSYYPNGYYGNGYNPNSYYRNNYHRMSYPTYHGSYHGYPSSWYGNQGYGYHGHPGRHVASLTTVPNMYGFPIYGYRYHGVPYGGLDYQGYWLTHPVHTQYGFNNPRTPFYFGNPGQLEGLLRNWCKYETVCRSVPYLSPDWGIYR